MTLVRVGTSPIDRQGLFAATDIPPGTRIIAYLGEKITKSDSARRLANYNTYIFHLNYHYDIDGETLANTARYINHSCDPNCAVEHTTDTIWIVALVVLTCVTALMTECKFLPSCTRLQGGKDAECYT